MSVYSEQSQKYVLYMTWFLEQPERSRGGWHPLSRVLNKCISEKALCGEVAGRSLFFVKFKLPEAETVYGSVPNKFLLQVNMWGRKKIEIFRSFIFPAWICVASDLFNFWRRSKPHEIIFENIQVSFILDSHFTILLILRILSWDF